MLRERHRNQKFKRGFSLVEVMVSLFVFSLAAAGIASATILTSKIAYSNIYRNTAFTVVQSYAEQIKSLPYAHILAAYESPGGIAVETKSLTLGGSQISEIRDPLMFGSRIEKDIVIDIKADTNGVGDKRIMKLWVSLSGRDLRKASSELSALEVTLDYEWQVVFSGGTSLHQDSVKLVKTAVTEY